MKKIKRVIVTVFQTMPVLIALIPLISTHTYGGQEGTSACKKMESAKAILDCALLNHPKVLMALRALEQAKASIDWAGQIPNPELSGAGNYGRSLGDTVVSSQVSLLQPIYFGGVVSSRKQKARAELSLSETDLLSSKEEVALNTVINLYRANQILSELEIIDETVSTFDKILEQFKSRVKLSPDQRASVNVFELVRSDFILKRSIVLQEEQRIGQFFEISIGIGIEQIRKVSPSQIVWPDILVDEVKSSAIQTPFANLQVAHAESNLANSLSWPTFKLGPSISYVYQGGIQYPSYGIGFSIDLPIFNIKGGQRSYAHSGVLKHKTKFEIAKRTLDQRKYRVVAQYNILRESLSNSASMEQLKVKHHKLEALFLKGLISPALVIEAHRQMLEYIMNRNEREIEARRLLWASYILKGSFESEVP